ncbi:hypothetical protein JKF63_00879 [Porcisia hertigi]|uniref:WW domain-containing protein n=1 Tax=Porcisia hertigi TaxID=2761500 RepID=A0A836HQR5_9TRYP|nr:hypothetical protein JKF63_00879 [Porcisia hertigi]
MPTTSRAVSRDGDRGSISRGSSEEEEGGSAVSVSASERTHTATTASTSFSSASATDSPAAQENLSNDSGPSNFATSSLSPSASASASTSADGSWCSDESDEEASDGGAEAGTAPRKLPRLEEVGQRLQDSIPVSAPSTSTQAVKGGTSIFPAPPLAPIPAPRYGPIFPRPPSGAWPVPAPLPTLSASAKDISEMDVRAGLRLGVFRALTQLNKEQVMDEIESVRMTSHVERVLLESPHQIAQLPGVPLQEREYAWATVFFSSAEAADLCAALLCQPGRRSKWPRVSIQRLPIVSMQTEPHTTEEQQRTKVHLYQMNAGATSGTKADSAVFVDSVHDTVLAQSAFGWCVLSTGGLFPTSGLAAYLQHRRLGDFTPIDVCTKFDSECDKDKCDAGGQCKCVHLRASEQWRLLVPPVLLSRKAAATGSASTPEVALPVETSWQKERHKDTLIVMPLPPEIDEDAFVYMFRWCDGFRRAQTVRTVEALRYGVVQFAEAANARLARQQATSHSNLSVRFVGEARAAASGTQAPQALPAASSPEPSGSAAAQALNELPTTAPTEVRDMAASSSATTAATHAPGLPFPPLPSGWEYGLSRRTTQYFFLQSGKKSTTWKHPVTHEQYKAQR